MLEKKLAARDRFLGERPHKESMRLRFLVVCYSARYHKLLILSSHHISTGTEHMKVRACHQIGGVINLNIAI